MAKTQADDPIWSDDYFLSASNPVANTDQRELETQAISIFGRPEIEQATKRAIESFLHVTSNIASPEALALLPDYAESYAFRSIQLAVNSDANYPKVLRIYSPAANWLGNDVPESRWGQENADNAYRIIPVNSRGKYLIRGQLQEKPPSHVSYMLVADTNTSVTEGLLEQHNMEIAPDGSFHVTLDDSPVHGRRNHIQLTPDAHYLFIRDALGDWTQTPNALRVQRLNPPEGLPLTRDELTERAVCVMRDGVTPAYFWQRIVLNIPIQTISTPRLTGSIGGLLTQLSCGGWMRLGHDEAAVISVAPLDAAYRNAQLYNLWGKSLEYRDRITSLNNSQMQADEDGRHTFVISARDPGIANWLDNMGMNEVTVMFRWQGLSPDLKEPPAIDVDIVKFADIAPVAGAGVKRVTPEQRTEQMQVRRQGFDRRFIDA